jgi:hypothetical protein
MDAMAQKSVIWRLVDRLISAGAAKAELAARIMVAMTDFILIELWAAVLENLD